LSRNSLQAHHVPVLQQHLHKFSSLKEIDISFSPALGCRAVVALLSSLTGALYFVPCSEWLHDFSAEAQSSEIKALSIACTGIENSCIDYLSYHILKFPLLESLDISFNVHLDSSAVLRLIASLAGKPSAVSNTTNLVTLCFLCWHS
jgi:hypothetical protein